MEITQLKAWVYRYNHMVEMFGVKEMFVSHTIMRGILEELGKEGAVTSNRVLDLLKENISDIKGQVCINKIASVFIDENL
eukprot:CAMPEP_0116989140 /NCGR_PEP_ID=MMETSP0467-20121206/64616_1 /TAXON_ID=283647 /ORGANISM="Mesodinium pulex, Strain SPMC105" /LENGTH=79 /DNA_ID=CAMNT_0004685477 /DNA_START=325 /DNA_END=561 /DNA_ORIENTATION=-